MEGYSVRSVEVQANYDGDCRSVWRRAGRAKGRAAAFVELAGICASGGGEGGQIE